MGEDCGELFLSHYGRCGGIQGCYGRATQQFRNRFGAGGAGIVRTGHGAGVAAIQAPVKVGSLRERPAVLDGEIAQTAARVDGAVGLQSAGRTCRHASAAHAAVAVESRSGGEWCRGKYLAQQHIGAFAGHYQMAVKAAEANAAFRGPVAFAERSGVNAHARLATGSFFHCPGYLAQARADYLVVVRP